MVAMSLAQVSSYARAAYPSLTDLPVIVPLVVRLGFGLIAGVINGAQIASTRIPPSIATRGMKVGMVIFGVIISGFTFLRLDVYYQVMIKGGIIVVDVVADVFRQKKGKKSK